MNETTQISEALRAQLEQPHRVRFWGAEYTVTPCVCSTVFGDGQQLVAFQPLDTRPEYYVLFVGSDWNLDNCGGEDGPRLVDYHNEILTALEEDYGSADDYEEGVGCEGEEWPGWPVTSFDSGEQWFELEMPGSGIDKPTENEARRE